MAEELSRVRPEHKFDEDALQDYLMRNLPGFPRNHGMWTVLQYRFVLFHVTGASVLNVCTVSRRSKSNPIELNFNRTQSNSIELNRWIEFD